MNFEEVFNSVTKAKLQKAHPLGALTTFKVGGDCKYYFEPSSFSELIDGVNLCKKFGVDYLMLGAGSNMLVSDSGYDGLVISTKRLNNALIKKGYAFVECGVTVHKLLAFCEKFNLGGFEFLVGIPATVGGLIATNAGAFSQNIGQKIESIFCLKNGVLVNKVIKNDSVLYRQSLLDSGEVLLGALLKTTQKGFDKSALLRYIECRKNQPKGNSCGCVFKNPKGDYAGRLIDACDLKGYTVNGAYISNKHANFIINDGVATASDIYALIKIAKQKVYQNFNIILEEEVRLIGDFK